VAAPAGTFKKLTFIDLETVVTAPSVILVPVGKSHTYSLANVEAVAVKVNSVDVPINLLISTIAVAAVAGATAAAFVNFKAAGAAGLIAVKVNNLAVEVLLGVNNGEEKVSAVLLVDESPVPFLP
jgi:hypothetical protein